MVRLVFRPYTQVRRSICTLEPLRTSTRVSSGFILLGHSSPSFGSRPMCSYSNPPALATGHTDRSAVRRTRRTGRVLPRSLSLRVRVLRTQTLAHWSDSLVRVSRRVVERHFVSIPWSAEGDRTRPDGREVDAASARLSPRPSRPHRPRPPAGRTGTDRDCFLGRQAGAFQRAPIRPMAETIGTLHPPASPAGNRC